VFPLSLEDGVLEKKSFVAETVGSMDMEKFLNFFQEMWNFEPTQVCLFPFLLSARRIVILLLNQLQYTFFPGASIFS